MLNLKYMHIHTHTESVQRRLLRLLLVTCCTRLHCEFNTKCHQLALFYPYEKKKTNNQNDLPSHALKTQKVQREF